MSPRRRLSGIELGEHVHDPKYYDFNTVHPELQSTNLLMRVYEALEGQGIPFRYSYPIGDSLATPGLREHITAHFYIPEINTVIIVQGGYWYENASRLQDTALMVALLEYAGYKVLWWGEPDIQSKGMDRMISDEPLFQHITQRGEPLAPTDYTPIPYRKYYHAPPRPIRSQPEEKRRTRRYPKR